MGCDGALHNSMPRTIALHKGARRAPGNEAKDLCGHRSKSPLAGARQAPLVLAHAAAYAADNFFHRAASGERRGGLGKRELPSPSPSAAPQP